MGFEPGVDVYNVFNTNPVLTENQEFGSSLGTPMRILQGRLMRLTARSPSRPLPSSFVPVLLKARSHKRAGLRV